MLTYASRAAARRVVTSSRRTVLSARLPAAHGSRSTRAIVARGFTSSQWRQFANSEDNDNGTKKATKKTTGTKKTTTTTTKKAATAKKTKKAKPVAKKKKKAVAIKKPRVVLTPEQKKEQAAKLKIKELKVLSLLAEEPKLKPARSWPTFVSERVIKGEVGSNLADKVKEVASEWKALPESDKQRYASIAAANLEDNKKILKEWTATFPVADIILANRARTKLKTLKQKSAPKLDDDRLPKKPTTAMMRFIKATLTLQPGRTPEEVRAAFTATVKSWRDLSAEQRKPFEEASEQDFAAYRAETAPLQDRIRERQKEVRASVKPPRVSSAPKASE